MRRILLLTLFGFLAATPLRAQEIKNPAELMPAKVVFYAEVRQPGALAKEVGRLVEGSALGNVPASLQKLREKYEKNPFNRRFEELGAAGLFFSQEVFKELERVQGAATAFMGMSPQGEPEFVAVVLPGQSNVPHFMLRALLAMERVRQVDTVEGVPLFRMYIPAFVIFDGDKKEALPRPIREFGPVYALTQGLIVLGSPDLVKDVIRRAKGKVQGATLAKDKAFQDAAASVGDKPGLFAYASGANVANAIPGNGALMGPLEGAVLNLVKSWKSVVWNLSLEQGTFHYREVATLDPQVSKQVMELLPAKGVDAKLFQYAPRDAILVGGLANPDGEKRLAKALDLIDQAVPPIQGKKISEFLKDLETQFGISLGKDLVGPITGLGFALGDPTKATVRRIEEKGPNFHSVSVTTEVPLVFIIQAADEKAAKNLGLLVPRLFSLLGRNQADPATETIGGLEIRTIKDGNRSLLSYGQHGRVLVIGPYAGPVAMSLLGASRQQGLSADVKLADRFKELDNPIMVLLMKPVGAMMGVMTGSSSSRSMATKKAAPAKFEEFKKGDKKFEEKKLDVEKKFEEKKPEGRRFNAQPGDKETQAGQGTRTEVVNPPRSPQQERLMKELGQILGLEDWFVLTVTRQEDRLVVDGKAAGLNKVVARLIDFSVEEAFRNTAEFEERRFPPGGVGGGTEVFSINDRLTAQDPPDRLRQNSRAKLHVFRMEEGHTYTIDLVSHKGDSFDNFLRLEDAAGNNLAQDDDSGGNLNARLVFTPMRSDNYRIIATSFAGGTGSYTLTIRRTDKK